MSAATAEPAFAASDFAPRDTAERVGDAHAPLCFIVDS